MNVDFRTVIVKLVFDRIYDALVVKTTPTMDNPMLGSREPPQMQPDPPTQKIEVRDPLDIPKSLTGDGSSDPQYQYHTPLWQVRMRPPRPEDVRQNALQPSAFIQVLSGERSRSGRGIPDSPVRSAIGDLTESYTIGITGVFSDDEGPKSKWPTGSWEAYIFNAQGKPKSLTEQVNGWIWDLDYILNVETLRPALDPIILGVGLTDGITIPKGVMIVDAYMKDWETRKGFKGAPVEIVLSEFVVTINYTRTDRRFRPPLPSQSP